MTLRPGHPLPHARNVRYLQPDCIPMRLVRLLSARRWIAQPLVRRESSRSPVLSNRPDWRGPPTLAGVAGSQITEADWYISAVTSAPQRVIMNSAVFLLLLFLFLFLLLPAEPSCHNIDPRDMYLKHTYRHPTVSLNLDD